MSRCVDRYHKVIGHDVRAATRACFQAMEREEAIDFIDMPEYLRAHYQYFTEARMERLRAAGYTQPFTSLEDGVASYVRGYLQTNDPYR